MSGIKYSFKYVVVALILLLILSACERPLQSDDSAEEEAAATEAVVTAVAEAEAVLDAEEAGSEDTEAEAEDAEVEEVEAEEAEAEEVVEEEVEAESESDTESPRPADSEAESDDTASEVEETVATDPEVGGGTPDTVEQGPETEAAEAESEAEETDESEAMAEESSAEEAEEAAAATGEETAEESESGAEVTEAEAASDEQAAPVESSLPATHTVQAGENLYRIGLQYGLSWVALARYNNIYNPNYIYVGQVLQIPGGSTPPPAQPDPVPPIENPPNYVNYTVKPGDTLGKIGQAFGVRPEVIAEVNGIVNPNLIYAGQVLKIPTSSPETPPATTHVVQSGETLYRISLQYGVHWLSIAKANNIWPPYVIYAGQTLVIPGG